jgi:hypothetical protein
MWKVAAVAYFKPLFHRLYGHTEENHENLIRIKNQTLDVPIMKQKG